MDLVGKRDGGKCPCCRVVLVGAWHSFKISIAGWWYTVSKPVHKSTGLDWSGNNIALWMELNMSFSKQQVMSRALGDVREWWR